MVAVNFSKSASIKELPDKIVAWCRNWGLLWTIFCNHTLCTLLNMKVCADDPRLALWFALIRFVAPFLFRSYKPRNMPSGITQKVALPILLILSHMCGKYFFCYFISYKHSFTDMVTHTIWHQCDSFKFVCKRGALPCLSWGYLCHIYLV